MIFFVANDGTIINSVPSQVYQGSAEANDVYLIAPFATGLQVAVAFKLPNGVYTERYPMTGIGEIEGVINKQSGKPYSGWQFAVPNEITQYFGTVTAQFFIYTANGAITATSSTSFVVGKGVPPILPDTPSQNVYDKILASLSALQQQLDNGWFTARAVAAWNSEYTYSGGDLIFYQDKGDYGVLLKSLTDNNKSAPYSADGVLDTDNWMLVSDFNILTGLYNLQTEMELAVKTATEKAQAAGESADNAQSSSQSSAASAQAAQEAAQSVQASAEYLEGIQSGTIAVAMAEKDGTGENIAEQFTDINEKIPSTASAENQLADKAFVNSSINNMAAFYITSNAQGDAFATRASLLAAATFYSGGAIREPTQNDYAIVLADESQPKGVDGSYPTTRYSYQGGVYPDGQWDFQYIVNNTSLTQDQVNAINSGITAQKIASMDAATAAKYTKPSSGIPESDLSANVQSKLNAGSSAPLKNLYNLGAYDTYTSNGDSTGTVTRKTGTKIYGSNDVVQFATWSNLSVALVPKPVDFVGYGNYNSYSIFNNKGYASGALPDAPNSMLSRGDAYNFGVIFATGTSQDDMRQAINNLAIQYELAPEYQYNEPVIENQPIHLANQEEENYWHQEWRKGLNLYSGPRLGAGTYDALGTYAAGTYTYTIANAETISAQMYIINADGTHTNFDPVYSERKYVTFTLQKSEKLGIYLNYAGDLMIMCGTAPYSYEPYYGGIMRESDVNVIYQRLEIAYSPNNPPPLPNSRIALTLMRTNLTVSNGVIIADSVSGIEENTLYVFIKNNIPYLGWCISPEGEGDYRIYTSAGNGSGSLYRIQIINS